MNPFVPYECVVKITKERFDMHKLLCENNILRLMDEDDIACRVLEDILIYDK